MLGEFVGQESCRGEQQDERQQYQAVDDRREYHLFLAVVTFENGILDNDLMPQVDKGIEEYHGDIGEKAFLLEAHVVLRGSAKITGMLSITGPASTI